MIKNILEFLLFYPPFIDFLNYLPVQIRGEMTACHIAQVTVEQQLLNHSAIYSRFTSCFGLSVALPLSVSVIGVHCTLLYK